MKRKHLLIALASATLLGCGADNRSSIEITGRAAPSSAKDCTFSPGGDVILGNGGTYDVALAGTYPQFDLALYVQNNLVDPNTISPGATTASKGWSLESVRVRVNPTDYTGRYQPSPALAAISGESTFPAAASSSIAPGGGKGTIVTGLITDGLMAQLQAGAGAGGTVVLGVTLLGRTNDGARLDSSEWPFPLFVCNGCVSVPTTCDTSKTLVACLGQVPTCQ